MRTLCFAGIVALAMTSATAVAQTTPQDSAHSVLPPATSDPGRAGRTVQLPGGGQGVTTGGTAHYQTLGTPGGGSAVTVPNGASGASVVGSGRSSGAVSTHP
jgi:hypothetical protein